MADIQKATQLANMQIPEGWAAYQAQQSVEQDQFFQSGVIQAVPSIASAFTGGGKLVNIPMFKPLEDVAPQNIDDTKDITLNTIGTQLAQARLYGFLQAWSATDLSGELSGTDPLGNIGTSVQTYWRHINEKILLGTMDGVYASASIKDKNKYQQVVGGKTFVSGCEIHMPASLLFRTRPPQYKIHVVTLYSCSHAIQLI